MRLKNITRAIVLSYNFIVIEIIIPRDAVIDPDNEPAKVPMELEIARTSRGVNFKPERRRLPMGLIARG